MGSVFLAERRGEYTRSVALKLIKRGMDSDEIVRRFQNERQILANLEHPNIARLLEGGSTEDGRPYFAMEYVEGTPITHYCADRGLSTVERLSLFLQVCSAVQFSHQNLVVHRDLKPSNILVAAETGVPKLLDFGVAKLLEAGPSRALTTALDRRPMTVRYASPEQVRGEPITTASDIYSLGVLLYQLLTGFHPNAMEERETSDAEMVRRICEQEPRRPSTVAAQRLKRQLSGDLDAIALRALRKEPHLRYGIRRAALRGRSASPGRPAGQGARGNPGLPDRKVRPAQPVVVGSVPPGRRLLRGQHGLVAPRRRRARAGGPGAPVCGERREFARRSLPVVGP